jgi:hypothetical protein
MAGTSAEEPSDSPLAVCLIWTPHHSPLRRERERGGALAGARPAAVRAAFSVPRGTFLREATQILSTSPRKALRRQRWSSRAAAMASAASAASSATAQHIRQDLSTQQTTISTVEAGVETGRGEGKPGGGVTGGLGLEAGCEGDAEVGGAVQDGETARGEVVGGAARGGETARGAAAGGAVRDGEMARDGDTARAGFCRRGLCGRGE